MMYRARKLLPLPMGRLPSTDSSSHNNNPQQLQPLPHYPYNLVMMYPWRESVVSMSFVQLVSHGGLTPNGPIIAVRLVPFVDVHLP
mmetsp:Transcript_35382/g.73689  ORF Transcript_35382/g.73689 Transcript_35382/m.73689 type:complete len:86 (+) Transcript_35382:971-1228(+)